jgi:hypothetical protein
LTSYEGEEFFVRVERFWALHGPEVQFCPPLLWFFEAIPNRQAPGWFCLSPGGTRQPLIRVELNEEGQGQVEVAAAPLRRFLAASKRVLIVQHDFVYFSQEELPSDRYDFTIRDEWIHSQFVAVNDRGLSSRQSYSRLLGKHVIEPFDSDPCDKEEEFPEFIYDIDSATGQPLKFTCDEAQLSNYFVNRPGAPHYLTPVYFSRGVLSKYAADPEVFELEKRQLRCVGLWHLDMDTNPAGLVEVYLGDLGTYLPSEERRHWVSYNVPPEGGMNESRFRNDFLAQFTDSDDPIGLLREALGDVSREATRLWGRPLHRPLDGEDLDAWNGIHLMTTDSINERDALVVVLAKRVVESLDARLLRQLVADDREGSLNLLENLLSTWNADVPAIMEPLRLLQGFRSSGAAHMRGHQYAALLDRSGLAPLTPRDQFERLVRSSATALGKLSAEIAVQS